MTKVTQKASYFRESVEERGERGRGEEREKKKRTKRTKEPKFVMPKEQLYELKYSYLAML